MAAVNAGQLHRLARLLREIASAATADPGETPVSAGDLAIVEDVAHHAGTSIGQIAQRTGLAQSLVSKTVAAMRGAGVFTTAADPADGRRLLINVEPTTRADVLAARGTRRIEAAIHERKPKASPEELAQIEELLDELAGRLST